MTLHTTYPLHLTTVRTYTLITLGYYSKESWPRDKLDWNNEYLKLTWGWEGNPAVQITDTISSSSHSQSTRYACFPLSTWAGASRGTSTPSFEQQLRGGRPHLVEKTSVESSLSGCGAGVSSLTELVASVIKDGNVRFTPDINTGNLRFPCDINVDRSRRGNEVRYKKCLYFWFWIVVFLIFAVHQQSGWKKWDGRER